LSQNGLFFDWPHRHSAGPWESFVRSVLMPDDQIAAQRQGAVLNGGDRGDRTSWLVGFPV